MKNILILILLIISGYAFAQNQYSEPSSNNNHLYIGVGAGAAWNDVATPSTSFRLDGGYEFYKLWSIELGTLGVTQSGGIPNQSMQYYDASIKAILPIADNTSFIIQLGGAYGSPGGIGAPAAPTENKYNLAGWNLLTAAGFQYNLTQEVAINITDYYYSGATNPQGSTNALLGGVNFNF